MQGPEERFFPFLVVQSDFKFLVIPSGCYWVPDIYFFNLLLDKKRRGEGGKSKGVPPKQRKNYGILSNFVS